MVIKASTLNSDKAFNLDGLDYDKGVYTIYYANITKSGGNLVSEDVHVGIRLVSDFSRTLVRAIPITSWNDGTDDFSDLDSLVAHITGLISFNSGGGVGAGIFIRQRVDTFDDLVVGEEVGDLSYVENSQGTAWNPFSTYKPAGWYVWDGSVWNSDRNAIANQLEQNILNISSNDADILAIQNDLANIDQVQVITADYELPDSATISRNFTVKNNSSNVLTISTIPADKIEGEDTLEIYPTESFEIHKNGANDYLII